MIINHNGQTCGCFTPQQGKAIAVMHARYIALDSVLMEQEARIDYYVEGINERDAIIDSCEKQAETLNMAIDKREEIDSVRQEQVVILKKEVKKQKFQKVGTLLGGIALFFVALVL